MEDYDLIVCRWECGAYSLQKMVELVRVGAITKDEFHDITSFNYDGVVALRNL